MAHLREQIRDRVITLVTGLTTTGTNVFRSRVYPMEAAKLPGLCVYTQRESSEPMTMGMGSAPLLDRTLELVIEGYARANSDIDETLDDIAIEVEEAIAADNTLNDLAKYAYLESTEVSLVGEGDKPIGAIRLTYNIQYVTSIGDVETSA